MTYRDIVTAALEELGVVQQGDSPSGADAATALARLTRLLDTWNAERRAVYADVFDTFMLSPNVAPHTIGPSGATWTTDQRPVSIEGDLQLVLNASTPNVKTPITQRTAAWWNAQPTPTLTSAYPTDVYYDPTWPNGSLYFWPVPTVAYAVSLWRRVVLTSAVSLDDDFTMPPGYQEAVELTLAERCLRPFRLPADPDLQRDASLARARIFGNNMQAPRIRTQDAGMPGRKRGGRSFNYLSRTFGS